MSFETRALTGTVLAERYLVGELARETEVSTQFRGEDMRTSGAVNIDVVREGLGAGSHAAKTLELEAITACDVGHPNIVTPRDVGVLEDGSPFVVTTRLDGETLEDRVCLAGGLPIFDVVRIGLELLSALAAAHDLDVIHGDLRPESVFLVERDGVLLQTLVSGFGRRSRDATRAPLGFANVTFVAPELSEGAAPSIATDIYAASALLYLAATGFPPYDASLRAPDTFRPQLPARLARVLVPGLQADPWRRLESAREMLRALEPMRADFGASHVGQVTKQRASSYVWTNEDTRNAPLTSA